MKGRQGRVHASREDALKNIIERERELYNANGIGEHVQLFFFVSFLNLSLTVYFSTCIEIQILLP